jgi:hypothetical protein
MLLLGVAVVWLTLVPRGLDMGTRDLLLLIIILLLIGAIPAWPHSRGWGYRPSGILGLLLVVVLILAVLGRI